MMTSPIRERQYINESIAQAERALEYGLNFGFDAFGTDGLRKRLAERLDSLIVRAVDAGKRVEESGRVKPKQKRRVPWSEIKVGAA